jgi:hypothetical protein
MISVGSEDLMTSIRALNQRWPSIACLSDILCLQWQFGIHRQKKVLLLTDGCTKLDTKQQGLWFVECTAWFHVNENLSERSECVGFVGWEKSVWGLWSGGKAGRGRQ